MSVRSQVGGRVRGRIGSRGRRAKLVVVVATVAASVLAISVSQTGAYFTGASTTASQSANAATLPAPASMTVSKTGATSGQSSAVSWTAPATRPWEASAGTSGTVEYTVQRNTADVFTPNSGAVQVYKGTGTSVTDASGSAPVSLASQVAGFSMMDGSVALVDGVPYRWGTAYKVQSNRVEDRNSIWAGASGQAAFSTGTLTEMQFASTSAKEELTSIAPGRDHACALTITKKVYCIGFGSVFGQTGQGTTTTATTGTSPVQWAQLQDPRGVFTGKTIVQITSGEMFSCALASDGTIGCWGVNDNYQLGNGGYTANSLAAPIKVAQSDGSEWAAFATNKPIAIAAGSSHVCALKGPTADGVAPASPVACWGASASSALGTYSAASRTAEPQDIVDPNEALTGATSIFAGNGATCVLNARTATTNVACWGWGGLIGRASGSSAPANSASPAPIQSSVTGFTTLDMSSAHACGAAGTSVVCWGANSFGKLGSGTAGDSFYQPAAVVDTDNAFGGAKIISVGAGWSHSCAATERGVIACWGLGGQYQLGQGSSATDGNGNSQTVKPVVILFNGAKMGAAAADLLSEGSGRRYSLARINGGYYAWGTISGNTTRAKMTAISGYPANITKMVTGEEHACAITGVDDKIYCSGGNSAGQLGNNTNTASERSAVMVSDPEGVFTGKTVVDVAASAYSTCALTSDGTIGCWGNAQYGQLTERSTSNVKTPLRIGTGANGTTRYSSLSGTSSPVSITGGSQFFCARTPVSVVCWGINDALQLGRTTANNFDPVPSSVSGGNLSSGVSQVDGGLQNACAVKTNGVLYCWGRGAAGMLGNGSSSSDSSTPVVVPGNDYLWVSVGYNSSCALTSSSTTPRCWGYDSSGQLGRGGTSWSNTNKTPDFMTDPGGEFARSGVSSIFAGAESFCALTKSGRLYCWGYGADGQLAQDGSTTSLGTPTLAYLSPGVTVRGVSPSCQDGAVLSGAGATATCSLVPSRTYYYQVTYTVSNVANWVSARASASR